MERRLYPAAAETCVWMDAGVLNFKLCDRHLDCEHCLLDAAIRGAQILLEHGAAGGTAAPSLGGVEFPDDRLYGDGHTWLRPREGAAGRMRFGLDSLAAALIACPKRIRWQPVSHVVQGDLLCAIEMEGGVLNVSSPVAADGVTHNRALDDDPQLLITDPYARGWIAELSLIEDDRHAALQAADMARQRSRLDLRRLRRLLAFHLLADTPEDSGHTATAAGAGWVSDVRHMLDEGIYLRLVGEILH